MAVTQYIGARYVPLFYTASDNSNSWEAGVQYDPLTIVTWLNQSYTSKIPVPATVGNPADNPTYWILTGAYNAQISQLSTDVTNLGNDVTALDLRMDAAESAIGDLGAGSTLISIGDSYAAGNTISDVTKIFPALIATALNKTLKNYAQGGSGFRYGSGAGIDFLSQLATAAADSSFENTDVGYIIITGGRNDATYEPTAAYVDIYNAINGLLTYAETNFPNAKIVLAPMLYDANIAPQPMYYWYTNICKAIQGTAHKVCFVKNAYAWLCGKFGCIATDQIHPSLEGHTMIAGCLLDAINGGDGFHNIDQLTIAKVSANISDWGVGLTNDKDNYYVHGYFTATAALSISEGMGGQSLSAYTNIPCYMGNQTFYMMAHRTDNNSGAYPIRLEYNTGTKTILLRSMAAIPAGPYAFDGMAAFGRYQNAVTG